MSLKVTSFLENPCYILRLRLCLYIASGSMQTRSERGFYYGSVSDPEIAEAQPRLETSPWSSLTLWCGAKVRKQTRLAARALSSAQIMSRGVFWWARRRIKNPFTIVVETFNTTHRIRSYDPMALRLIQKVSVLFAPRHRRSSVDYDVIYAFKPPS